MKCRLAKLIAVTLILMHISVGNGYCLRQQALTERSEQALALFKKGLMSNSIDLRRRTAESLMNDPDTTTTLFYMAKEEKGRKDKSFLFMQRVLGVMLRQKNRATAKAITDILSDDKRGVQLSIALSLRHASDPHTIVPDLIELTKNRSVSLRINGVYGLGVILGMDATDTQGIVQALVDALRDSDVAVRSDARYVLARIDPAARSCRDILQTALEKSRDIDTTRCLETALSRLDRGFEVKAKNIVFSEAALPRPMGRRVKDEDIADLFDEFNNNPSGVTKARAALVLSDLIARNNRFYERYRPQAVHDLRQYTDPSGDYASCDMFTKRVCLLALERLGEKPKWPLWQPRQIERLRFCLERLIDHLETEYRGVQVALIGLPSILSSSESRGLWTTGSDFDMLNLYLSGSRVDQRGRISDWLSRNLIAAGAKQDLDALALQVENVGSKVHFQRAIIHDGIFARDPIEVLLTDKLLRRRALIQAWKRFAPWQRRLIQKVHMACWIKDTIPDAPVRVTVNQREDRFLRRLGQHGKGLLLMRGDRLEVLWSSFLPIRIERQKRRVNPRPVLEHV